MNHRQRRQLVAALAFTACSVASFCGAFGGENRRGKTTSGKTTSGNQFNSFNYRSAEAADDAEQKQQRFRENPTPANRNAAIRAQRAAGKAKANERRAGRAPGASTGATNGAKTGRSAPQQSPRRLRNVVPDQIRDVVGVQVELPPGTTMPPLLTPSTGTVKGKLDGIDLKSLEEILRNLNHGNPVHIPSLPKTIDWDGRGAIRRPVLPRARLFDLIDNLNKLNQECEVHNANPPDTTDVKAVEAYCRRADIGNAKMAETCNAIQQLWGQHLQNVAQCKKEAEKLNLLRNRRIRR